jgi:hypothetical protein
MSKKWILHWVDRKSKAFCYTISSNSLKLAFFHTSVILQRFLKCTCMLLALQQLVSQDLAQSSLPHPVQFVNNASNFSRSLFE